MNPRYLQRFGDPQPFRDSIARAALRYNPEAPYGEPELEGNEGQRLFEQPDFQPSMNRNSMVATPSTAQMAADMTPNVYRPENGEPYTNTGAPWHQGQLPAVPRGDLLVSSSPLDERTNPIPGEAGYNDASEMASSAPMSQPLVTAPPSAPMENPIVRAGRERAESPEMATGMVGVTQQQMREPAAVTAPPSTAPPPESTMAMLIRQRLGNVLPDRKDYPVSKWAKLAAVALGAGQGYYNAANPNARPIDASEAVQNLTFGRKYLDAMGKHQRTNKNLDEQIKLVGEAEDIESRIADRLDKAKTREDTNKDRDDTRVANNFKIGVEFAKSGSVVVPRGSPLTPGAVRIDANPLDPTGKTVVDVMPTGKQRIITDQRVATALGRNLNDSVSDAEYIQGAKEVWEYDKAIKLKELEVAAKPDSTQTTDYKDFLLAKKEGYTGKYPEWREREANLRRPQNNFTMPFPPPTPSADGGANPTVKAYATYRQPLPARPVNARNPNAIKAWDDMYAAVTKENPYYSFTGINTMKDFLGGGKTSQSLNAINTAAGHLSDLNAALKALDRGDVGLLNQVAQAYSRQTGGTVQATADTIIPLLAKEVARVYVAAGGTADERNEIQGSFNATKGYAANQAALAATAKMFASKMNAMRNTFEVGAPGAKWEDHKFVSPEAQRVFDSFAPTAGPGRGGSGPKNGDIKTYPNGNKARFDGTGWVKQ